MDYILTHCAPTSIALQFSRHNVADHLTDFLQEVKERAQYHYWLFGHHHGNKAIDTKHILVGANRADFIEKAVRERAAVPPPFLCGFLSKKISHHYGADRTNVL